jgi:hypothetical protein
MYTKCIPTLLEIVFPLLPSPDPSIKDVDEKKASRSVTNATNKTDLIDFVCLTIIITLLDLCDRTSLRDRAVSLEVVGQSKTIAMLPSK